MCICVFVQILLYCQSLCADALQSENEANQFQRRRFFTLCTNTHNHITHWPTIRLTMACRIDTIEYDWYFELRSHIYYNTVHIESRWWRRRWQIVALHWHVRSDVSRHLRIYALPSHTINEITTWKSSTNLVYMRRVQCLLQFNVRMGMGAFSIEIGYWDIWIYSNEIGVCFAYIWMIDMWVL